MLGMLRRLAGLERAQERKAKQDAYQHAAMREGIRADGNSRIDPMGGAANPSQTSSAVWNLVIKRMNRTN